MLLADVNSLSRKVTKGYIVMFYSDSTESTICQNGTICPCRNAKAEPSLWTKQADCLHTQHALSEGYSATPVNNLDLPTRGIGHVPRIGVRPLHLAAIENLKLLSFERLQPSLDVLDP